MTNTVLRRKRRVGNVIYMHRVGGIEATWKKCGITLLRLVSHELNSKNGHCGGTPPVEESNYDSRRFHERESRDEALWRVNNEAFPLLPIF
jgi:hypothetical protein